MEEFKFSREVDENCDLMDHYTTSSGNSLPTFRNKFLLLFLGFLTLEEGTNRLSRNVSKELPLLAA
jgi:hypothetical protein